MNRTEYHKLWKRKFRETDEGTKANRISQWKVRGIISDDFDALYERYINTKFCELCSVELTTDKRKDRKLTTRCLDHCHESGLVRNILCNSCNISRRDKPSFDRKKWNENYNLYQRSMGGSPYKNNNSLLKISMDVFN